MNSTTMHAALAVALTGLLSLGGAAAAQAPVTVHGRVLEFSSETPVATARVELLDGWGRRLASALSDSAGAFQFENVRPGSYTLRAGSLGYREVTTPEITVAAGEPVHLIVRIGIDAVPLAPLEVVSRPQPVYRNVALAAFAERADRRMGGHFALREEIEERQPRNLSEMIRLMGSFTVLDNVRGGGFGGTILNNRAQCEPSVYIDGRLMFYSGSNRSERTAFDAVNSVHWSSVEGIEVYSGASTVPAEFSGARAGCGVIAIWLTR